jgi:DNA polymerase III subunit epsilon
MKARWRFLVAIVVLGLLMTGPFVLTAGLVWFNAGAEERELLVGLIGPRIPLGFFTTLIAFGIGVLVVRNLYRKYVQGLLRMAEHQQLMLEANRDFRIEEEGPPEVRAVARASNVLAEQRDALLRDVEDQIARAKQSVEEERNRLAALMAELTQSVVVCNLDGRILLYNSQARQEFCSMSDAPLVAGGGELIGLGRSIYAVFDRNLVGHALETIQYGLRGSNDQPVAHFVTTGGGGQLLRVRMSPVMAASPSAEQADADGQDGESAGRKLTGFILMLDNITRDFEHESRRDQMIHSLTEGNRAALANVRAASEMLEYPDLEPEMRQRFRKLIRDEVEAMSEHLDRTATELTNTLKARWPLEEMLGADLVAAVQRRIEARLETATWLEEVDESLWVRVDSFSLLQALLFLVSQLAEELEVREVGFRLSGAGRLVHLDLVWSGQALSTGKVSNWELAPMNFAGESSPLTVRDVIDRHGGEIWLERENGGDRCFFRLLLPAASPREQVDPSTFIRSEGRPEYYDFDLFKWSEKSPELDDLLLTELTYTVFDTETTGLNPSEGDEIIQIGATRIVNGKMLRHESFEQLVDPRRPLAPESMPIHGIKPEMLAGQPTIDKVLPAFHAFAAETVLVGHNAAFDMRFLEMKEKLTGLVFDQPVLDTLLLSVVVHPHQESHRLDVIAERLNVPVVGRHTALGDAIVTAEIFIRLLPLLAEKSIRTLRQAREAAEQTFYARIKY